MSAPQAGKSYIILNVASSTVLDLNQGAKPDGTKIQGWELAAKAYTNGINNQVWTVHREPEHGNGQWFSFTNRASGTAIDGGGVANQGKQIYGSQYNGKATVTQQWLITRIPASTVPVYQLYNRDSYAEGQRFSPDLAHGSPTNGTPILSFGSSPDGTNRNQVWLFIQVDI